MPREILLIDDSKAIHALVRARLTEEPATVLSAYSGQEGLAAARKFTPDLVLLNVDLPDIHGLEVCRELKADAATANIPVIFLAGAVSPDDRIYGPEVGAADFISKPFNPAELRHAFAAPCAPVTSWTLSKTECRPIQSPDCGIEPISTTASARNSPWLAATAIRWRACWRNVDHFTSINETYGRAFGDEVLRGPAPRSTTPRAPRTWFADSAPTK